MKRIVVAAYRSRNARKAPSPTMERARKFSQLILLVALLASLSGLSAQSVAEMDAIYRKTEVSPGVWSIVEKDTVNMFLVIGAKRALLIDTGYGRGNIAAYVRSITGLPVTVVNTHGHPDHSGGDSRFDEIHAHPGDMSVVKSYMKDNSRFIPVTEGYVFELGGRAISVIEVPGHTAGSIALLDSANGLLFTGDNNNGHVWLFLGESRPLETYMKSLDRLIARSSEFSIMYLGHGAPYDPAYLREIRECGKSILSGKAKGTPYPRFADAIAYDYGRAKIVVNPARLRERN